MASKTMQLRVTNDPHLRRRVQSLQECRPGLHVVQIGDIVFRRLVGAKVYDQRLGIATVQRVRFVSMPNPHEIHTTWIGYLPVMLLGAILLHVDVVAHYDLDPWQTADFDTMREQLSKSVETVRSSDRARAPWLPDAIRRAKSLTAIHRMTMEALS